MKAREILFIPKNVFFLSRSDTESFTKWMNTQKTSKELESLSIQLNTNIQALPIFTIGGKPFLVIFYLIAFIKCNSTDIFEEAVN